MTAQQKEKLEEAIRQLRQLGSELNALNARFFSAARLVQEATSYSSTENEEPTCKSIEAGYYRCELPPGHKGEHKNGSLKWRRNAA